MNGKIYFFIVIVLFMFKIRLQFYLLFFLCSCTTLKQAQKNYDKNPQVPVQENNSVPEDRIDLNSLQRLLELDQNIRMLGFNEKTFNTCQVGFGFSTNKNCQKKYFIMIHFKLMCRSSEGTISTILTEDDLTPVAAQKLTWYLKNLSGSVKTDSSGYAEIAVISNKSQKLQRLRLSNSNDFVLLKAEEIKSLIVPINWCN